MQSGIEFGGSRDIRSNWNVSALVYVAARAPACVIVQVRTIGLAWRRTSPRKVDFVALGQIVVEALGTGRQSIGPKPAAAAKRID